MELLADVGGKPGLIVAGFAVTAILRNVKDLSHLGVVLFAPQ